jgi:hypothetical protein
MRDPGRIPMVLDAVERRWRELPDEHLLPMLLRVLGEPSASEPDPLAVVSDAELIAALRRGWDNQARSMPPFAPVRPRREVLGAIADRWREAPDMRFGQVLVNTVRDHRPHVTPHPLFGLSDGSLLEGLGRATDEERRYAAEEPAAARRGGVSRHEPTGLA